MIKGVVTSKDFGGFLINLIKNQDEIRNFLSSFIFYIDNAATHMAKYLDKIKKNINIMYGPSYSPQLNPIEGVFSLWKYIIRAKNPKDENELIKNIMWASKKIKSSQLRGSS